MQTFMTESSYFGSLSCLDPSRLGNQVYRECKTILSGGWKHHPISKMWKGYEYSLCEYALAGLQVLRELRDRPYPKWEAYFAAEQEKYSNTGKPAWTSNEELHASHRSNLLWKGRIDSVWRACKKSKLKQLSWMLHKEDLTHDNIERITSVLLANSVNIEPNWYAQFGWTEPDNLPYVWVVEE